MPFLRIAPVLGAILIVFGLSLLVPWGTSVWRGEDLGLVYSGPLALTILAGAAVTLGPRYWGFRPQELQRRDGLLLVGLVWTLLPLFASLPFLIYFHQVGQSMSFTRAYFEAMSGITTTGATVLSGLDALPASINLWRCFLQWMGGMGILVLAVAILPMLGLGGSQLFRAEATGPMKDAKLTPRITETAKGLWSVYCLLSVLCVLAYWWGGMTLIDAWIHMFSTLSLGGLSSHDASFAYFESPKLEWIAIGFMLLASGNFALYFIAILKRQPGRVWRDLEWRSTLVLMLSSTALITVLLLVRGVMEEPVETWRTVMFNVVSIASTTGYSTVDYTQWPIFAPILMLLLSGVATSAGSTGAGIKMSRLIILIKTLRRELLRMIHPRAVNPVTVDGQVMDPSTIFAVLAFMLVYGGTVTVLTMALLLSDMPFDTAFASILASVNNMGPGLNETGPAGNFAGLNTYQLWICTIAMLLGRLEMLSFLVLFTRAYWRK